MKQQSASQAEPGSKPNPEIVLHAKPHRVHGDIEWSLDFHSDPPRGAKAEVNLPKDSGSHQIVIHLVAAPGIRFHATDPIWVVKDGPCPPPAGSTSRQIRVIECLDKKLTLLDVNDGRPCELAYQLNFVGAPPFDPMIRNGGVS